MVKNFRLGLVFVSLVMVAFAVFVVAISYDEAPTDAENGTTITMLVFNVSNTSATGNTLFNLTVEILGDASFGNITNVTLFDGTNTYYNDSLSSTNVTINVSVPITQETNFTVNFTISSSATDNITILANVFFINNETNVSYSPWPYISGATRIDSLEPNIQYGSGTTSSGNLSQNFIFVNVSVIDTVSNISTAIIYLYNSTGQVNSSTNTTINAPGGGHVFNFTSLDDGVYYINATVNDSYNHVNNSLATRMIRIDTTNPVASASCSPSSGAAGTITCTCIGTDIDGSGVASTTASSTPSTTGTYTCSVTDYAGNSDNSIASYTITSTTSSSVTTYPKYYPTAAKLAEGYRIRLSKNYIVNFESSGNSHVLTVGDISADSAKVTISSDPITLEINSGETKKVDLDSDGYYDLKILLEEIAVSRAYFVLTSINEEVVGDESSVAEGDDEAAGDDVVAGEEEGEEGGNVFWIVLAIILIVILVIVGVAVWKKEE